MSKLRKPRNERIKAAKTALHPNVYKLSRKYGPPKTDLRKAEIIDSHGSEEYAQRQIDHQVPEDVLDEDFDYYTHVYAFMDLTDLVFYLYPIAIRFLDDIQFERIDAYLYALDHNVNAASRILSNADAEHLKEGLHWLFDMHSLDAADWGACTRLQRYMGLL